MSRTLAWFSCGAASAVAAKLTVEKYPDAEVLYCDTLKYEHPDNARFLLDVSLWIGKEITILRSEKFKDIYDVFERERYLKGPAGAPCTRALKRNVRKAYQRLGDLHVFGFTSDEEKRIADFELDNPDLLTDWPLRDRFINKSLCYRWLRDADIPIPAMYLLGYKNNNCIGCVKGGAGYWNKLRRDFAAGLLPFDAFSMMARMERRLGYALLKIKKQPCFLDELPPDAGRYDEEPDIECGVLCSTQQAEVA